VLAIEDLADDRVSIQTAALRKIVAGERLRIKRLEDWNKAIADEQNANSRS
jgi:hypothetical protein